MHLARVVVAVSPEHELLEHEEQQDAEQQRQADVVRDPAPAPSIACGIKPEERRAEQRAGREADEVRQHRGALAVAEREEDAGGERAQDAAERREQDDQGRACSRRDS